MYYCTSLSLTFALFLVTVYTAFAAGWIYGLNEQVESLGWSIVLSYMASNFLSVALACGIWFGVDPDDGGIWGGFVALIGSYLIGIAVTLFLLSRKKVEQPGKWTWSSILWELTFKNVFDLTERIKPVVGYFPFVWCVLVKQFIPHVLLILFVNLAQSDNGYGDPIFGNYENYVTKPFQVLGILTFVFAATLFTLGFVYPQIYHPLRLPEGHFGLDPEADRAKLGDKELQGDTGGPEGPRDQEKEDNEEGSGDDSFEA